MGNWDAEGKWSRPGHRAQSWGAVERQTVRQLLGPGAGSIRAEGGTYRSGAWSVGTRDAAARGQNQWKVCQTFLSDADAASGFQWAASKLPAPGGLDLRYSALERGAVAFAGSHRLELGDHGDHPLCGGAEGMRRDGAGGTPVPPLSQEAAESVPGKGRSDLQPTSPH